MEFQESNTFKNLQNAFLGKLIASSKYQIYGMKARDDGYVQIGNVFDVTARNEREHAIIWLKSFNNGEIPSTLDNLLEASQSESNQGTTLYQEYARVAKEEGYGDIAALFNGIANIDLSHDLRFRTFADNIENEDVFCKEESALWICTVCGNIMGGECAPVICPICGYPQGYYQLYTERY